MCSSQSKELHLKTVGFCKCLIARMHRVMCIGAAGISYELAITDEGVCLTCRFPDNAMTHCVAVVHQRISQLNSSVGLMNIESSHKFTRSGDTASGCVEGVNLRDHQVGVIGGRLTAQKGVHTIMSLFVITIILLL